MQDLTGGYCPHCDTVWAAPGVCNCYIPYHNTKEGMHETGTQLNIAPYNLGCSCDECNKAFEVMLVVSIVGMKDSLSGTAINAKYEEAQSSVYSKEVWNEAIEAAAKISDNWNFYCAEEIRGLKK